ncbi:DUF4349 domain-containing protein [Streptomyces sp. A1-5]|uniref:DUF4349 domain-containing protein n=1 Tax=Streptomyces sp. A1-5 TaxID=2738410 RepID=UPI001F1F1563|nr:DUF4349 domain-containing protein [Streptomyces sp. A1-5]UJB44534.1 DUF4349 domain-containing protein [Streptomyces sp. A1-5]
MHGSWGRRVAGAAAVLAVSLAAAGCGAPSGPGAAVDSAGPGKGAAGAARQQSDARAGGTVRRTGGGTAPDTPVKAAQTQIIRTATLTVQTADVAAALTRARGAVEHAGGYAADETTDRDADGRDRSKLVLRVPPEHYDALLTRLSGLGKVLTREVSAKDVTDQVVDVDSRVTSQRASVERIRALMDRASSIGDITALESELGTREANLESLEARLKSLKDRTGTATVTLLLRQPGAASDPRPDDGTSFGDALSDARRAFTAAVRWVLVALAGALPFAAVAAGGHALWRAVRGRRAGTRPGGRRPTEADGGAETGPADTRTSDAGPAEAAGTDRATPAETAKASETAATPGTAGESGGTGGTGRSGASGEGGRPPR